MIEGHDERALGRLARRLQGRDRLGVKLAADGAADLAGVGVECRRRLDDHQQRVAGGARRSRQRDGHPNSNQARPPER
ncbi:MAG TPA: hypothetical protein VHO06_10615 [Polyangia bacterium]|nr:hypothetical protein [Polyangia bacterium]